MQVYRILNDPSHRCAYPNAGKVGPTFALSAALRALGLPCGLQKEMAHLAWPVEEAA